MTSATTQPVRCFRDLVAWQRAFAIGCDAYKATRSFPSEERFGITIQIRRSAVSIASNIAEGYGRGSTSDYIRFLKIARGSIYELDTQLLFAVDFGYVSEQDYDTLKEKLDETERVLAGLIRSIDQRGNAT